MAGSSENAQATFAINLGGDAAEVSEEAAAELEKLRETIHGAEDSVKQMRSALRSLRGESDEVKGAKAQLNAMVDAERNKISAANLQLLKQGQTYDKLAADARKLAAAKAEADKQMKADALAKAKESADRAKNALEKTKEGTEKLGKAIDLAGGPIADLKGSFSSLEGVLGGAEGVMGAVGFAFAGLIAACVALTAALVAGAIAFVRFVVVGADAARSLNLVREAATGSAENARNLGTQVDALAARVATGKEKLNDLAASLARTRLSGQAIVDTFNAVGQASAAMGDDVGNTIKGIITRGQQAQRIQINPLELQGTGLSFKGIASELAAQLKIGTKEAEAALFEGRVKLEDGAKALRAAVEKRFGEINARKLLTLDVQAQKFRERLGALTADVNLEPLLKGLDTLQHLFDGSTVTGATLKTMITTIGNTIGPAFEKVAPIVAAFFKGLVIGALDVAIAFLKMKKFIVDALGGSDLLKGFDVVGAAVLAGKIAVYGLVAAVGVLGAAFALSTAPIWASAAALYGIYRALKWVWDTVSNIDWKEIGTGIVDGIVNGLEAGATFMVKSIEGLADKAKDAFKGALGIHSPSKVFAEYGQHTAEGYAEGVEDGAPRAAAAASAMAPSPGGGGASGGGGGRVINVTINVQGGGGGQEVAKQLSEPSFLAQLTKAIEDAVLGAGVPTQGAT
ncbi:MAG TPA: hypothetical protein VF765_31090 [Polyangiaceae bacterium]